MSTQKTEDARILSPSYAVYGVILLSAVLLLTAFDCYNTPKPPPNPDFDLAAQSVCYSINHDTGQIIVSGVIQNVGAKTVDFNSFAKVPGPNNTKPKGLYLISADVQGAPHQELQVVMTDQPFLFKPGDKFGASPNLTIPFHPNNVYSRLVAGFFGW